MHLAKNLLEQEACKLLIIHNGVNYHKESKEEEKSLPNMAKDFPKFLQSLSQLNRLEIFSQDYNLETQR